jgi:hypothetical protein
MNVDEHLASGIYNDFTQSGDVGVGVDGGDANVECPCTAGRSTSCKQFRIKGQW